jgi:hypothetical protein
MTLGGIAALTFDVFGTVVDWRGSLIREGAALSRRTGIAADWGGFADAWRGRYQPSLADVREGRRPWTRLDDLHPSRSTVCCPNSASTASKKPSAPTSISPGTVSIPGPTPSPGSIG